jgi:hypothetical protein
MGKVWLPTRRFRGGDGEDSPRTGKVKEVFVLGWTCLTKAEDFYEEKHRRLMKT